MEPSNIMLLNRYHVLKKFATIDFSIFCMSNIEPFKMTYSGLSQMEIFKLCISNLWNFPVLYVKCRNFHILRDVKNRNFNYIIYVKYWNFTLLFVKYILKFPYSPLCKRWSFQYLVGQIFKFLLNIFILCIAKKMS